jgi:hypothetical protein
MGEPSDFIVFADESGDHGLARINPDYPVFVLSCCVFDKKEYVERVCPELQRFKLRWWPHDAVVLHSSQIRRHEPPFAFLASVERRERFMKDLAGTLQAAPFTLFSVAIDKVRLKERYAVSIDPYSLALRYCVELVVVFLREREQGHRDVPFLIEKRGKLEDAQLAAAFLRICEGENCWGALRGLSIELIDKKANLPGLQIADLVGTPIGRHVLKPHERNRAFESIQQKLWMPLDPGRSERGLKILPEK